MCTNSVGGRSTPPPSPLAISSDSDHPASTSLSSSQDAVAPAAISLRSSPPPGGDSMSSSSADPSPLASSSAALAAVGEAVNSAAPAHLLAPVLADRPGADVHVVIDIPDDLPAVVHGDDGQDGAIAVDDGSGGQPPVGGVVVAAGPQAPAESSMLAKAGRLVLSFGRDAIAQYGAKVLASAATTALSQALISSAGGQAASAAVNIGVSLGIGVGMNLALNRLAGVDTFSVRDAVTRDGSVLTKTARVVGMAAPLVVPLATLMFTQSAEATATVSQVFLANQVARAVRQLGQSFIAAPQITGVRLATQDGQALSEAETVRLNTVRDLLYVASSLVLTGSGMHVVPALFSSVHGEFDLSGPLFGALNEGADGVNPDLAKILYSYLPAFAKPDGAAPNDTLQIRDAKVPSHLSWDAGLDGATGRLKDVGNHTPLRLLLGATGSDVLGAVIALGKKEKWDAQTLVALTVINAALSAALTAPRARLMGELTHQADAVPGGLVTETGHALGVGLQAVAERLAQCGENMAPVLALFGHHPDLGNAAAGLQGNV